MYRFRHQADQASMTSRQNVIDNLYTRGIIPSESSINDECIKLSLLIGMDNFFKIIHGEKLTDNIYAFPSKIGPIIAGTVDVNNDAITSNVISVCKISVEANLDDQLKNFWELDKIGITETSSDFKACEHFDESISFENGKYSVGLPWKESHPKLPTNKNMAFTRMVSVWNALSKDEEKLLVYDKIIKDQLARGFIEIVGNSDSDKIHYLAHHGIKKDSPTTPLRIVFDCGAKTGKNSPSLNDCLLTGPALLNDLVGILLRFRVGQFACISDIEKAYHMIGLNVNDRDSCRFFWPLDIHNKNSEICTYRFTVIPFGSTASQFLLNNTLIKHLKQFDPNVCKDLLNNIYVDNIAASFQNEEEMLNFFVNSNSLMSQGNFNLREWYTNSPIVTEAAKIDGRSGKEDNSVKVLGVEWNPKSDEMSVKIASMEDDSKLTKRNIVSTISKTFDPLGILLPVTLSGKLLIQKLWIENLDWDTTLPQELIQLWNAYNLDVKTLSNFKFPRDIDIESGDLHIFSDASPRAYGTVAYICDGTKTKFLIAKSRLAPIKTISLPQLELTALNLSARLAKFVQESLSDKIKINSVYLHTDSMIAYHWVHSAKITKSYVKQRVENIKELCSDAKICHVDGSKNPADFLTKPLSVNRFLNCSDWINGPDWLIEFTPPSTVLNMNIATDCEIIPDNVALISSNAAPKTNENDSLIPLQKYSSYRKL